MLDERPPGVILLLDPFISVDVVGIGLFALEGVGYVAMPESQANLLRNVVASGGGRRSRYGQCPKP